ENVSGTFDSVVIANAAATPDLAITLNHASSFTVGAESNYTITVANHGQGSTTGEITLTDILPPGVHYFSSSSKDWFCAPVSQTFGAALGVVAFLEGEGDQHLRPRALHGAQRPTLDAGEVADAPRFLKLLIHILIDREIGLPGRHLAEFLHCRLRQMRVEIARRLCEVEVNINADGDQQQRGDRAGD